MDLVLIKEWNNKVAGFVSYGIAGGTRSVEHLRLVMGELMIADVRTQVLFSLSNDFVNYTEFKPDQKHLNTLNKLIDQIISWSTAMKLVRV